MTESRSNIKARQIPVANHYGAAIVPWFYRHYKRLIECSNLGKAWQKVRGGPRGISMEWGRRARVYVREIVRFVLLLSIPRAHGLSTERYSTVSVECSSRKGAWLKLHESWYSFRPGCTRHEGKATRSNLAPSRWKNEFVDCRTFVEKFVQYRACNVRSKRGNFTDGVTV